ncbi:MAG: TolC family protein [Pseudomonadota bacterium]
MIRWSKSRKYIFLVIACVGYANVWAQSLEQAVILALETEPSLQAFHYEQEAAASRIRQARSGYLPQVDMAIAWGPTSVNNGNTRTQADVTTDGYRIKRGIEARQMLMDGNKVRSEVSQRRWESRALDFEYQVAAHSVTNRVAFAYCDVMEAYETLKVMNELVAHYQQMNHYIETRIQNQLGNPNDLLMVQSALAQAKQWLMAQELTIYRAEQSYRSLVGRAPALGSMLRPVPPQAYFPENVDQAVAIALAHNPRLKEAQAQMSAAQAGSKHVYADLVPHVNLVIALHNDWDIDGQSGRDRDYSAMVEARYAIRGGRDTERVKEQHWRQEKYRAEVLQERRLVEQQTRDDWQAIVQHKQRLSVLDTQFKSADGAWRGYWDSYKKGDVGLNAPLDAAMKKFQSHQEKVVADFARLKHQFALLNDMGRILSALHVPEVESTVSLGGLLKSPNYILPAKSP